MNIAYTIWIELLDSPIIRNQVIELLKALKRISPDDKYFLFAFQPISITHCQKFFQVNEDLKENNLELIVIPSLIPPFLDWFNAKWYLLPFIFIQSFPVLLAMVLMKKIDILHCRSYPIMPAAIVTNKVKRNLKIVFDPRSPFPEENITAGLWTKNSISYNLWKFLEKIFLDHSNITIAIANTYVKHFTEISKNALFAIIPNNVNIEKFSRNQDSRSELRSKMGVKDDEILFVYLGSLGIHWNNPSMYANLLISIRELNIDHRLLIITPDVSNLKKVFNKFNIKPDEYLVVSADSSEVPKYLSMADIGLNLMEKQDLRMSIKTCEYLAMEMPIIVNSNVMGARDIVEQYHVGLVLEDLNNINLTDIEEIILNKDQFSFKCRKTACENFSTINVAKKYTQVYRTLM